MAESEAQYYDEDEDEEMPLTERDLADDAQWKLIQKNTFTRWANEHLKTVNKTITDLENDFSDGLRLVALIEVLSGKKFKHVNRRPNFRTQKLENVTRVLEFLERDEGIRIVNIDSSDIVDSNLKLILGLIWTLILHYSISMPMWEGEEPGPQEGGPTPKQRLLNWVQSKVPDIPIKNFNNDWNNGKAIGALVDAVGPGLCPDWEDWDPKNAKKNAKEAMDAAEKWLDVPQLIKPDEMTNPKIDEMSMMTYLAQFPKAKLKPGAPLRPKLNPNRVRAYGPGLEPKGNQVGAPARFTVETFSAGSGSLEITVLNPKGVKEQCEVVDNKDRNMTYSCVYVPSTEGEYKVIIKFGAKEVNKSPFKVKVEGAAGDASKVSAAGPGIEKTGVVASKRTYFEVFTKNSGAPIPKKEAGKGNVDVVILDPHGRKDTIRPSINLAPGKEKEGIYLVEYVALETGLHSVNVYFAGQQIPKSPFGVGVGAASNAKMCYATGRGIQPRGVRVKDNAPFKIHTKGAGNAEVKVQIIGPGGIEVKCIPQKSKTEEGVWECSYMPIKQGQYIINITFGGEHITKSPFKVDVGPTKTSKIRAYGPGLTGGVCNQPARFTVETNGEVGALGFSIEGPSEAKIDCKDNGDGSADVTYYPTSPGEYAIHILCNEEDIPESPYMAEITPATNAFDASKVTAEGPGLAKTGVTVNKWAEFTVDARKAGKAALKIVCEDDQHKPVTVEVVDKKNGTYTCKYMPKKMSKHTVTITWGGVQIPNSPFRVNVGEVSNPANVKVYGPGVEKGVKTFKTTYFIVDCKLAGPGDIAIALTDAQGKDVPVNTIDNQDGTFKIEYTPSSPGTYTVSVFFANSEIPKSPIKVNVESSIDLSKVKVVGLDTPIKLGEKRDISVITKGVGKADGPVKVTMITPSKKKVNILLKESMEIHKGQLIPTEVGPHIIEVTYGSYVVPQSPFTVNVTSSIDLSKVKVVGLDTPIKVNEKREISVITKGVGKADGPAKVTATTPSKKKVEVPLKETPEGYVGNLTPTEVGKYTVDVSYGSAVVPKSPFTVDVTSGVDLGKVTVTGLDTPIKLGEKRNIKVITKSAGKSNGPAKVTMTTPSKKRFEIPVRVSSDGYEGQLVPTEVGPHKIDVTYGSSVVPKSPFTVNVTPGADLGKVKVTGLDTPIKVNERRDIAVLTKSAGKSDGPAKVTMTTPTKKKVEIPLKETPEGYVGQLVPTEVGPHKVDVSYGSSVVPKSPFTVDVIPGIDLSKVKVTGLDTPIKVQERRDIAVLTKSAGKSDGPAKVTMTTPSKKKVEIPLKETPEGYVGQLVPTEVGPHKVDVAYGSSVVPKSPFTVDVTPGADLSKVKVTGLDTPIKVQEKRDIAVLTKSAGKSDGPAKVTMTTPTKRKVEIPLKETPEGFVGQLVPTEVGPHKVDVAYGSSVVPKSPFSVNVVPGADLSKVKVTGLDTPIKIGEQRDVAILTKSAGPSDGPARVTMTTPSKKKVDVPVKLVPEGYIAQVVPFELGPHKIDVAYGSSPVPKSPFTVDVVPEGAGKVKAFGPGLTGGKAFEPATFTIDTRECTSPGELGINVDGPMECQIDVKENPDGTVNVSYMPEKPGNYNIDVTYGGIQIPKSPFKPKIEPGKPTKDLSGVKVFGPGVDKAGVFLDSPTEFTVDAKSVSPNGTGTVRAIVTNPSGTKNDTNVDNKKDGTYAVLYTPVEEGTMAIDVTYDEMPVPQSPLKVNATPGSDATRVRAYGPGLEGGITDKKQEFTVDIKGAGQGGLGLAIDGPAETQIGCKDNHDGTCTVDYLPVKPGDYAVSIKFAEQDIPGSPFNVKVKNDVNPNKVRCYGPGLDKTKGVRTGAPATFTVNTAEAGEAPLEVSYIDATGKANPVDLVPVSETEIQATYYPKDEGKAKVDVQYAGKPVPGSPFPMEVFPGADASKVLVSGPGVGKNVHASMPAQFTIDTRNAGIAPLDVLVQRPDGSLIKPKVTDNGDGTFAVQYIPDDLGTYVLRVKYAGKDVPCSPFKVTSHPTGDASKCVIKEGLEKKTVQVNKETVICVDASQAGEGKVTCRIRSPQGSDIDIDIVENADGTFSLLFTPQIEGAYTISIKFGGQTVPGGEYDIQVTTYPVCDWNGSTVGEDLITADTVDSVKSAAPGAGLFAPVDLRIPVGPIFNFVSAYVVMPSGKKAYPKIEDNKDGTVTIRYQPTETGLHELHVNYNNSEIEGSPFKFHVDAVNSGHVTAYGPGLTHGIVNEPAYFTIVTKDAGAGGLSLSIEGPSKTEIKCQDNGDGTCTVSYVPTAPGEYQITVKFAGQNISGSPFTSKITSPPGEIKRKSQFGRSSEFELKIVEEDIGNLMATIRTPSGTEEPCLLKRLANGHLGISFTPREVGVHLVNVYRNGHHIQNSPFQITVGETELGNASKVKVSGPGLEKGMANELNEFTVDTKDAGYGGLSLSIEGPSKADIECTDNEDGACIVTYKPTEPGNYIVNVKFADEHVPGSPFNVKVGGEPSPRLTERITRHREAADVMHIGSQCELSLKIPVSFFGGILTSEQIEAIHIQQQQQGTSPFDMTASVTNPSGITELCDIVSLDDNHYSIKFVPKEMGVHTVSVKHKDMHIPGSPFEFTVGPIAGGGSHKVHAAGPGLERGEVDQPCDFNIYTREAGAGGLSIAVEGPSKAELDFDDRKDGSCGVTYRVTEPGEYLVSIKFNDEHIPDSPFKVDICPSIGDARKISVSALQQKGLQVGKPAAFVVNFNDAQKGKLKAKVVAPSGTEEEAIIQEIDDGQYAVRFIPRENGGHNVHVFFNDCEIPESPFRIMVGKVDCDPGMVHASGDGLRTGNTGQPAKFLVNTVNAGPGALGVTVEGPSKVKLECAEKDEGYEFTYTPTAPGDYLITIRYAGVHIAGSPFKAKIEGQAGPSDVIQHGMSQVVVETVTKTSIMSKFSALPKFQSEASRVTCEGNGLKKAFRGKQATFNVDVTNGGNNMMFVGMMGPKGPCEELCVHHKGGYVYKINYVVKERGDYMLVVKWGEDHIPGSPFCVHCD
ncbi:filamin-B-like isoform X4 [Mytilus trossulus]|uniref:filamin-B-like isoform X4 n=1 Tax=Mytilus trossulus TaxID=6551 RepID=UPI0030065843